MSVEIDLTSRDDRESILEIEDFGNFIFHLM